MLSNAIVTCNCLLAANGRRIRDKKIARYGFFAFNTNAPIHLQFLHVRHLHLDLPDHQLLLLLEPLKLFELWRAREKSLHPMDLP